MVVEAGANKVLLRLHDTRPGLTQQRVLIPEAKKGTMVKKKSEGPAVREIHLDLRSSGLL